MFDGGYLTLLIKCVLCYKGFVYIVVFLCVFIHKQARHVSICFLHQKYYKAIRSEAIKRGDKGDFREEHCPRAIRGGGVRYLSHARVCKVLIFYYCFVCVCV